TVVDEGVDRAVGVARNQIAVAREECDVAAVLADRRPEAAAPGVPADAAFSTARNVDALGDPGPPVLDDDRLHADPLAHDRTLERDEATGRAQCRKARAQTGRRVHGPGRAAIAIADEQALAGAAEAARKERDVAPVAAERGIERAVAVV